ncbi:VWA domain-containing protein [Pseudoteredinibacter isoporae]|uniref:Ca-activated chloride channel family protein n=1 Tax=Pseudoteredinibacter isoporae TaxID=570281 RepID=A0A7X0MXA5_9GAMM|nr:VWA domain-containing protein [Pseudoteredinibacter isoporae]MBB6520697.1 Ca-activated chloride channel family protein [Pseudoteredinibacter isoporae]NHO86264.1 VWA domain-containing protein [Pseudoteredinibacter isoporae]NIB25285.1 VWA domain-containing protein [Pseudoteredinibacter isoporae]
MLMFENLWAFLLLPAPWLVRKLAPAYGSERRSLKVPFFDALLEQQGQLLQTRAVQRRQKIQVFLLLSVWFLLLVALAKPVWLAKPVEVREPARDLLVAVDLSGSMSEQDFAPEGQEPMSRLRGAKQVLAEFAKAREGDRFGLMVYGDAPYLQLPFSEDKSLFIQLLEESRVRMAGPKTMLGDAIGFAYKHFQHDAENNLETTTQRNKVLLLLSDGNDSGSRVPPKEAARLAAGLGIKIYPVLLGNVDAIAEQAVDQAQLKALADITGGRYFHAQNRAALAQVSAMLDRLEPSRYAIHYYQPSKNLFFWPVLCSILLVYLVHFYLAFQTIKQRREIEAGRSGELEYE